MKMLDNRISDIETRMGDLFQSAQSIEEASTQESLSSYGWILLDCWVAYRTVRYLVRKTDYDDNVYQKWFKTPSSYTGTQLFAAWQFTDDILAFIEQRLGKALISLIKDEVQKKRNTAAHFNGDIPILGNDYNRIGTIFDCLSTAFLFSELQAFLEDFDQKLSSQNYHKAKIFFNETEIPLSDFSKTIINYSDSFSFDFVFEDDAGQIYTILFEKDGCSVCCGSRADDIKMENILNADDHPYLFFENNGYIFPVESFYLDVMKTAIE